MFVLKVFFKIYFYYFFFLFQIKLFLISLDFFEMLIFKKYIISMYFQTKNILKNNNYYNTKRPFNVCMISACFFLNTRIYI